MATDWRRDVAINELKFRVVDRCLIGPHRAFELIRHRLLRVHLLLRHRARLLQQIFETLIVQLRVAKLSLILKQLRLRRRQLHLVRTRIDQDQQIAFVDLLPFAEIHLDKLSIHPTLHAHRVVRGDRA